MSRIPVQRPHVVLLWTAAVLLAVAGAVATFVRPFAPSVAVRPGPLAGFAPPVLDAVATWVEPVRLVFVLVTCLELAAPLALVATGSGRARLARLDGLRLPVLGGAVLAGALAALVTLPLRFWVGYVHATDVGLRTGSAARWLLEWSGAALLRGVLVAVAAAAGLALVRRRPCTWVPLVTVLGTLAAVALLLLEPLVTTRLRFAPEPLPPGPTSEIVTEVLAASSLQDVSVVVAQASRRTTSINAYVTGVGPTLRVVLYDNLLELPPAQVAAVVAHEVAHAERADTLRGVLGAATLLLPGAGVLALFLRGRRDRLTGARAGAAVVLLVLVVELVGAPVVNWQSRRVEAAADARALELTGDPAEAVRVARRFVTTSLTDPTPPGWVVALGGTHPSPTERIAAAVGFARRTGRPLPGVEQLRAERAALPGRSS